MVSITLPLGSVKSFIKAVPKDQVQITKNKIGYYKTGKIEEK